MAIWLANYHVIYYMSYPIIILYIMVICVVCIRTYVRNYINDNPYRIVVVTVQVH